MGSIDTINSTKQWPRISSNSDPYVSERANPLFYGKSGYPSESFICFFVAIRSYVSSYFRSSRSLYLLFPNIFEWLFTCCFIGNVVVSSGFGHSVYISSKKDVYTLDDLTRSVYISMEFRICRVQITVLGMCLLHLH